MKARGIEHIHVGPQRRAQELRERSSIVDRVNAGKHAGDRRHSLGFDCALVEEAGVVVGNLARDASGWWQLGRGGTDEVGGPLRRKLVQFLPRSKAGTIRRDLGLRKPPAVRVAKKILAWRDRRIHTGKRRYNAVIRKQRTRQATGGGKNPKRDNRVLKIPKH